MERRTLLAAPLLGAAAVTAGGLIVPTPAEAATYKIKATWQGQQNGSWCGPASLRIAISARKSPPSQSAIASRIGTTISAGTNRQQMLRGAKYYLPGIYKLADVQSRGGLKASSALREQFWKRLVTDTSHKVCPIVNIVVPPGSRFRPPKWTNKTTIDHWFVVYGVETTHRTVFIADPASGRARFNPNKFYAMRFDYLCQLVAKAYLYY